MCLHCTCTKRKMCYDVTFLRQEGSTAHYLANGANIAGLTCEDTGHLFLTLARPAGNIAKNCKIGEVH